MNLFKTLETSGHEEVVFCHNKDAGLRAIVAIHNTALGPALGGLRMWPYTNESDALEDVLRLSRGMSFKAAVAGLNLGGGKAVIIGDPKTDKSEILFRALGRFVNSLGGRYITAEDVGIDVNDMEIVLQETDYCVGVHQVHGGSGDPSPFTAYGVVQAIRACLRQRFDDETLGKYSFAVQGVGHVGYNVAKLLRDEDAKVFVSDIDADLVEKAVAELGCEAVASDEIYDVDADVFSPSALGAVINAETIPRFKFKIIAGAANNQLANEESGDAIEGRNILYAPDYAANAGGLMNVSIELEGYDRERALRMMRTIYYNVGKIFKIARRDGIPTWRAADRMAEERIAAGGEAQGALPRPTAGALPRR
ncbi:MAG: Glu/Leu/Phe/Val dehydrogenase, partial [Thermoanaerobaculia bacterium]|nr:Glu/Leu/Phe/Val dehydrogenase [Thermoanaerobaculia bacterium]